MFTAKQISSVIRIAKPVKNARVSQEFGEPASDYLKRKYKEFGLVDRDGKAFHNGIDFATPKGQKCFAVFDGTVTRVRLGSPSAGNYVIYRTDEFSVEGRAVYLEFRYLHLWKTKVKVGERVKLGDVIGLIDSTGFSTGHHLHFDVRVYIQGQMVDRFNADMSNGHLGYIDPDKVFVNVNWNKFPVDRYYDKKRNWGLEYTFRFANTPVGYLLTPFLEERIKAARYVHKVLKSRNRKPPHLTGRELNAIIYGSWSLRDVLDPAMFALWAYYTKAEYDEAVRNGIKITTPLII